MQMLSEPSFFKQGIKSMFKLKRIPGCISRLSIKKISDCIGRHSCIRVFACKKLPDCNKGASLLEIIAASAIIGTVFVSFLTLFSMSNRTMADTFKKTDMMMIAQDLMEQYCSQTDFGLMLPGTEDITLQLDELYEDLYNAQREVQLIGGASGLKKIIIRVKTVTMNNYSEGTELVTQVADIN